MNFLRDSIVGGTKRTKSVAEAFVTGVSCWPEAQALPHTVQVSEAKVGMAGAKFKQLVLEAWCETFGIPSPTKQELEQAIAAAES